LGARRRELNHTTASRTEVAVEPPPEAAIELLGAVDIRDRDDDDLEFHVAFADGRIVGRVAAMDFGGSHGCLLA